MSDTTNGQIVELRPFVGYPETRDGWARLSASTWCRAGDSTSVVLHQVADVVYALAFQTGKWPGGHRLNASSLHAAAAYADNRFFGGPAAKRAR